jgi:spore coat polysaccharide biosynthesis protein SpsF (cytidylyltransferase family)
MPLSEEQPQQHSQVAESLWDNPEFIQTRFHIGQFIMAVVDTKADWENINALYSHLKSTSAQIDISALKPPHYTFWAWT